MVGPSVSIRKLRRADKVDATIAALGKETLDSDANVLVHEDGGQILGAAVGLAPGGDTAILGQIVTKRALRAASARTVFHELLTAHVKEAIELGYKYGEARIPEKFASIIKVVEQRYGVTPEPSGWEPNTGKPVEWTYRVNLLDFAAVLER